LSEFEAAFNSVSDFSEKVTVAKLSQYQKGKFEIKKFFISTSEFLYIGPYYYYTEFNIKKFLFTNIFSHGKLPF